ncbi:MAG: hypothetical protein ACI9OJ_006013 [Myxococcota bacterium]|jgi:hypothetical protein
MSDFNPYAAPSLEADSPLIFKGGQLTSITVDGKRVSLPSVGGQFPELCVLSGATSGLVPRDQKYVWLSPWWYLLLFAPFGMLALIIVYFIVRKRSEVRMWVHPDAVWALRRRLGLGTVAVLGALGGLTYGLVEESGILAIGFLVALVVAMILMLRNRFPYPTRIDDDRIWLVGFKRHALDELRKHAGP